MYVPTNSSPDTSQSVGNRVWLVAPLCAVPEPSDRPAIRDDMMRIWLPDSERGGYCTSGGHHHATWQQLHTRFDLVEVQA